MSTRFNVILADDLVERIEKVVERTENSKADVLRKAITMYLAAEEGKQEGFKVGLVDPKTRQLEAEFIGL